MQPTLSMLLIICPLVFLAGFVDSIAGGGGLISLPAYIFAGIPPHFAYGTNKFAMSTGTFISTVRFIKSRQIHYKSALASVVCALAGSYMGARLALALDEKYLRYCMIFLLPIIAVFILTRRNFGESNTVERISAGKMIVLSALSGLVIGAYDGFFGPGTGTFLILAYTSLIGFDLVTASGNAKMVNLASNIAALAAFVSSGKVLFTIGVAAACFAMLGNWVGSGLAIKNGAKVIRPIFICVLVLLFIRIGYDIVVSEFF